MNESKRRGAVALAALALLALGASSGCGTTRILTEPGARIYVDGQLAGRGETTIRRNGPPGSVHVEVRTEDGRRKSVVLRRQFTLATLGVGAITYGVGLLACWQHHAAVQIVIPGARASSDWNGSRASDPWMDPPSDWGEP